MTESSSRLLRVFLCHSSADKPQVRELYHKLVGESWMDVWLDEVKLLPGQDWDYEIEKALEKTDAVIVILSTRSVSKEGYVQKELRFALDIALEKSEGAIFILPMRLDDCERPRKLRQIQCVDYFPPERCEWAYTQILRSLELRANALGMIPAGHEPILEMSDDYWTQTKISSLLEDHSPVVKTGQDNYSFPPSDTEVNEQQPLDSDTEQENTPFHPGDIINQSSQFQTPISKETEEIITNPRTNRIYLGRMEFCRIPAGKFLMGNGELNRFLQLLDFSSKERPQHQVDIPYEYWMARFPVTNQQYNEYVKVLGKKHPVPGWEKKATHPVVNVSWKEAMTFCQWLSDRYAYLIPEGYVLRLPTEAEWEKAARGTNGLIYPWGDKFDTDNCNSLVKGIGGTTPVKYFSPQGDSPYGCADMVGNVFEWTHSLLKSYPYKANDGRESENDPNGYHVYRGGSFVCNWDEMRAAYRPSSRKIGSFSNECLGFRLAIAHSLS